jgi:hypothetical protein
MVAVTVPDKAVPCQSRVHQLKLNFEKHSVIYMQRWPTQEFNVLPIASRQRERRVCVPQATRSRAMAEVSGDMLLLVTVMRWYRTKRSMPHMRGKKEESDVCQEGCVCV